MLTDLELVTLPEASRITGKTPHNIRDYLQRQRIGKYNLQMKMHTIGIEISPFNCLIAQVKTQQYDLPKVSSEILEIEQHLTEFSKSLATPTKKLEKFKKQLLADCQSDYLNTWFVPNALLEMWYYRHLIPGYQYQDLLRVLLSRAVRSSRLVPHYDLATPKQPLPVGQPYWCRKHQRYCTPIDNCQSKIHAYSTYISSRASHVGTSRLGILSKMEIALARNSGSDCCESLISNAANCSCRNSCSVSQ
ncbi:MAG: hypothetical protein BWK78_08300 [Thiotrichaceae bacterium IS1]|nr:MAG: hypothetical protein BWK78_08300 [Thiotrichaceae bacterium IS1]